MQHYRSNTVALEYRSRTIRIRSEETDLIDLTAYQLNYYLCVINDPCVSDVDKIKTIICYFVETLYW